MFHKKLLFFVVLCLLALIPASLAQDFDNPACSIETFTMSPSYGAVPQGTHIDLHGRGNCDGGVRAVRFEVHGIAKAEIGSNEQWETFKTEEFSLGTGLVCFAVAGGNNTSWLAAERRCYSVTIEAADSSSTSGGQTGSPSEQNNNSGYSIDMDIWGWCNSEGYTGAAVGNDAYSWYCRNSDGSYGRSIDVDPVCVYSSDGTHPYAGLGNASDPYSWYCATTPQGRPSEDGGNPEPQNVQPTQAPATSGGSNSGSCSFAPLSAGDRGRVTAGLDNRVRTGPNTDYQYLTSISEYTQFDVLSGPYAGSGYCWYEIRLDNGTVGYTAAGTYSDPWLEWVEVPTEQSNQNNTYNWYHVVSEERSSDLSANGTTAAIFYYVEYDRVDYGDGQIGISDVRLTSWIAVLPLSGCFMTPGVSIHNPSGATVGSSYAETFDNIRRGQRYTVSIPAQYELESGSKIAITILWSCAGAMGGMGDAAAVALGEEPELVQNPFAEHGGGDLVREDILLH